MYLKGIGIAPHPPVIIPEVGGGKALLAEKTVRGMKDLALKIAEAAPEVILCITPHGYVFQDGVAVVYETKLSGNLGDFGAPEIQLEKSCDMGLLDEMNRRFGSNACETIFLNETTASEYGLERTIDHGTLVPLYFIEKVYPSYKLVHITIGELSLIELYRTGRILREAIEAYGKDAVILASADLSHCLKDEGPYSYNAMGSVFDAQMKEALESRDYYSILTMPAKIYEPAGQCGLRPIVMALGATDSIKTKSEVFSYEGPFGVGYLTGWITFDLESADPINESLITRYEAHMVEAHDKRLKNEDHIVALARQTIDTWVESGRKLNLGEFLEKAAEDPLKAQLINQQTGVFVSIHKAGVLRGCMGTLKAVTDNLAEEIIRNAIEACAYDPRFLPVESQELYQLEISVDVLGIPEIVEGVEALDPARYGIIVEKGLRRGVLLPDLIGIDTAEQQLAIAKEKACIPEGEDESFEQLVIQRFEVERHESQIEEK